MQLLYRILPPYSVLCLPAVRNHLCAYKKHKICKEKVKEIKFNGKFKFFKKKKKKTWLHISPKYLYHCVSFYFTAIPYNMLLLFTYIPIGILIMLHFLRDIFRFSCTGIRCQVI